MYLRKTFKLWATPAAGIRVAANIIILGMALTSTGCATSTRTAYAPARVKNQATAEPSRTSESNRDTTDASSRLSLESDPARPADGPSAANAAVSWTSPSAETHASETSVERPQQILTESAQTLPMRGSTRQIDAGAATIASAMRQALNQHLPGSSEPAVVVFGRFRNQSRASADEFAAAVNDVRSVLTAAAAQQGIACIDDALTPTPYELEATIYLLRDGAIDSWEIFLTLRQRTGTVLWESDGPVRMQRAREWEYRQLVYPAKPRK